MSNKDTFFDYLERYYSHLEKSFVEKHQELKNKVTKIIQDNPTQDYTTLVTKVGQIYGDIRDIIFEMEDLVTQIDEERVGELTEKELERIENQKTVQALFETFAPLFILFHLNYTNKGF